MKNNSCLENNNINILQGKIEDDYELGSKIGKGAFSVVYEAIEKSTKEHYAIKCINKKFIKKKLLEREIEIMTTIRHENILFCKAVYESENYIYLVLELVKGGELYDKIVDEGEYSEDEAKLIVLQIINAVEYLHKNGIAHRDLKPENILCGTKEISRTNGKRFRKEIIKVADFGLSKMFSREDLISRCGSPTYVAPEVLMAKPYDKAVDMWAVGVITFVILTGCFPFFEEGNNYGALYKKIIDVNYSFPEEPQLSDEAKDFISKLLVKDSTERYTPEKCRNHPWLKNKVDI
jgi:calcium/calmodulin-dependent protein kinase I